MPRDRRWDDPWARYPASKPLPAEGGLATSRKRGAMAATWWSERFTTVLESYGLGARMQRGRRYARSGQVLILEVRASVLAAQVQGSRRTPYRVTISLPEPSAAQWRRIEQAMAAKVAFAAQLLAGELPAELEAVFTAAGVPLFPVAWRDVRADCSCPDWENPCKHIAAVLYVFADQLDADPWLLLAWRGRTREAVIEAVGGGTGGAGEEAENAGEEIAPWWPFPAGPLPDLPVPPIAAPLPPDRPDAVLDSLAALDISVGATPVLDLLRPLYRSITAPPA